MKKELLEMQELANKVKTRLNYIKNISTITKDDVNTIKTIKNSIYERSCKIFIYNLKKLIQLETTQKNLAKKIGISEDLLSKYKSGGAFPSIETLIYICEIYNINLNKFISSPLTNLDLEIIENGFSIYSDIFEERYYAYFFVTNLNKEGAIHEGIIEFSNKAVKFKILSNETIVKSFCGHFSISDKLIFFTLQSSEDGCAYINMIKPNINKNKYVGGLGILLLPSDANSKPCSQKILFSKIKLDRTIYYNNLKDFLSFSEEETSFGNIKISQMDDEMVYNFIESLLYI